MKIETATLTSHNGFKQNVSTRINEQGRPEITSRSGNYRPVNAGSIAWARGRRREMQITAMMIAVFN